MWPDMDQRNLCTHTVFIMKCQNPNKTLTSMWPYGKPALIPRKCRLNKPHKPNRAAFIYNITSTRICIYCFLKKLKYSEL